MNTFGSPTTVSASAGAITVPTGCQHVAIDPGEGGPIQVGKINFQSTPNNGDLLLVRVASTSPQTTLVGVAGFSGGNLQFGGSMGLVTVYANAVFMYLGGQLALVSASGVS